MSITITDNETGGNEARAARLIEGVYCPYCGTEPSTPCKPECRGYWLLGPPATTLPPRTRTQVQWALLCDRVINEALPGSLPAITTLMLEGQRLIIQAEIDAAIEAVGSHGRYGR